MDATKREKHKNERVNNVEARTWRCWIKTDELRETIKRERVPSVYILARTAHRTASAQSTELKIRRKTSQRGCPAAFLEAAAGCRGCCRHGQTDAKHWADVVGQTRPSEHPIYTSTNTTSILSQTESIEMTHTGRSELITSKLEPSSSSFFF